MKELVHKKKGYRDISDTTRDALLREAVVLVKKRFSYGVAVTVNKREYEAQAPRWIRGFKNAYPFLCHLAMAATAEVVRRHDDRGPIIYIFESGHAYEAEARHAVHQMAAVPDLKKFYLHHDDSFLPKKDAVPLQAADLLAWETTKFKDETLDMGVREIRLSLLTLFAANPKRYSVHFCGGHSLTSTLKKYAKLGIEQLEEQQARSNFSTIVRDA